MHRAAKYLAILPLLTFTLAAVPVAAQVDEAAPDDNSGEMLEEIVVYGSRSGDPSSVDPKYAEIWRQQMLDEVERMRLQEEMEWRNSNLTYQSSADSRIVWGYDPKSDRDRRTDFDYDRLPGDTVKPATLFRAKF